MKTLCFYIILMSSTLFWTGCAGVEGPGTVKGLRTFFGGVREDLSTVTDAQEQLRLSQSNRLAAAETTSQFVADRIEEARYVNRQSGTTNGYVDLIDTELGQASSLLPLPSSRSGQDAAVKLELALSNSEKDRATLIGLNESVQSQAETLRSQNLALSQKVKESEVKSTQALQQLSLSVSKSKQVEQEAMLRATMAEQKQQAAEHKMAKEARLRVATIFMSIGGLIVVAGLVATYLHVSGILFSSLVAGGAFFGIGWLTTVVEGFLEQTWFKITLGVVVTGTLALVGWFGYKAFKTRKTARLDSQISNSTIAAIQELRNDDERFGLTRFEDIIKPYLEEWHTTSEGYAHPEVRKEIDRRLVRMNLRDSGKKTAAVKAAAQPASIASFRSARPTRNGRHGLPSQMASDNSPKESTKAAA